MYRKDYGVKVRDSAGALRKKGEENGACRKSFVIVGSDSAPHVVEMGQFCKLRAQDRGRYLGHAKIPCDINDFVVVTVDVNAIESQQSMRAAQFGLCRKRVVVRYEHSAFTGSNVLRAVKAKGTARA